MFARKILPLCLERGVFTENTELATLVIELFGKNSCLEEARVTFESLPRPGNIAWHFMVQAYILAGKIDEARELFDKIPTITAHTRNVMLGAYLAKNRLADAKALYDRRPVQELVTWCIMFTALVKSDHLDTARGMLWAMPVTRIDIAWNVVIQAYCKKGLFDQAKEVFDSMPGHSKNPITYRMMVTAYAQSGHLAQARELLREIEELDGVAWNEMIQAYARFGHLGRALEMMDLRPGRTEDASRIAMIQAAGKLGRIRDAETIFASVTLDRVAYNALLTAYARAGLVDAARKIFHALDDARNETSWSNMIQCYAQRDLVHEAEELFDRSPYECVAASTAMVGAYARAALVFQAKRLFDSLVLKNATTWAVMIGGYARSGHPRAAIHFFHRMVLEGVDPTRLAFTAVLTACQLKRARYYLSSMGRDYGIPPGLEHYHCLLELLGRNAKLLDRAEELVNSMPFFPDAAAWTILKRACEAHGDTERAARITVSPKFEFVSAYDHVCKREMIQYLDEALPDKDPSVRDYGIPMAHLFTIGRELRRWEK
ncbi:pentatricopeptide repeat-containing protein At4g02750-like [Selaginella moellendorffii]|uniref:pentatricopeptide repeat-containing protein At4g02750-like n=1 Tax=Selaginella moellendorffii TaxID=88036 RepID=UPI000D1C7515|nr:pentatricopeptide repeat-containing protein At4g02750-like [Selaginella moellendorffii]|eukprot:XP_024532089.1 pentatricopeptide repeat-containing protein At4g02750-like [Selaginella moellendorffii]